MAAVAPPVQMPTAYEFRHVKCDPDAVHAIVTQHQSFFWELVGTNTVVSKESHLESGGLLDSDSVYSVTTTERFSTIEFKRVQRFAGADRVKVVESDYFALVRRLEQLGCSVENNYKVPPPRDFNVVIFLLGCVFYIIPGVLYYRSKQRKHAEACATWNTLSVKLDRLLVSNAAILNM
jgi:hypothetical protein